MVNINIEMLKNKLYPVAKALFMIGETLVDESKQHISEQEALGKIRSYLREADVICSRYGVDRLIEDCVYTKPVSNTLDETENESLNNWLNTKPLICPDTFLSVCDQCSNNPKNGGSGICNCTIPYMQARSGGLMGKLRGKGD